MLVNVFLATFLINSLECGTKYGFSMPLGRIERFYSLTTSTSLFCGYEHFQIDYTFTKYTGKNRYNDFLYLHSVSGAYQYPFIKKKSRIFNITLGGTYNRILRRFEQGKEANYALGIKYGIGYKESLGRLNFISGIYLNQIIQTYKWRSLQVYHTDNIFSLVTGISFSVKPRK